MLFKMDMKKVYQTPRRGIFNMQPPMRVNSADDFQTPPIALIPLLKYINKDWTIWECADGKGLLSDELSNKGYRVITSEIDRGQDFLNWSPLDKWDCIITNPPYSLKQQFLERCYSLGKPFALLLPLTTFETAKRQNLFKEYGIEVIMFDKRINFITSSGQGKGSWFATAWFTNGLNIGSTLTFERL